MMDFLRSISITGWILILLILVGIWALPGMIRTAMGRRDPRDRLPHRSDGRPDHPPPGAGGDQSGGDGT